MRRREGLALLVALVALLWAMPARGQGEGRAGIVVVHGDGSVERHCVAFAEETASGYDLLLAAGVEVISEQSAMGATICSLEGEGCAFPREACFCQCQGRECVYWSYWQQDEGGVWRYSGAGASNARVRNGAVEGWVWGPGSVTEAPAPPAVTFAELCPADAPNTPAAIATEAALTTVTVAQAAPAAPAEEVAAPQGATDSRGTGVQWGGLLLAALPLPLLAVVYLIWRRRKNHAENAEHSDL